LGMNLDRIRNIGIAAHVDAGKTTVTERILFYAERTHKIGEVHDGTTITDWMVQERERGITITSASTHVTWKDNQVNIIDTPGHVDFTIEVERSLRVMDSVVVVFCAVGGVQSQSETVWRQADRYHIPRLSFINKMDRVGADYRKVIDEMQQRLKARPVLCQIPIGIEDKHKGMIDLVTEQALIYSDDGLGKLYTTSEIPEEYRQEAAEAREKLLEELTRDDEELLESYYAGTLTPASIIKSLRKATIASKITPVFLGSAYRNKGVQPLLDAVVALLPSPLDLPNIEAHRIKTHESVFLTCDPDKSLAALAFKVQHDSYLGKLIYIRVYQGRIKRGMQVLNTREGKKERVMKLVHMHANHKEEIDELNAGDIGAIGGLKFTTTGDTLSEGSDIALELIYTPEPVIRVAIEPDNAVEQEKLKIALDAISDEDPTFKINEDEETGQTLIAGMGELHLDIIVDRIQREFNVGAKIGKPQVAYKETITKTVEEEVKYETTAGTRGIYGHVKIRIEPDKKAGNEVIFVDECPIEIIPKQFHDAVKRGVSGTAQSGPLASFPMIGIKVTFIGGGYSESDSNEIGYEVAASMALRSAIEKASPALMEPIMKVEIETPEAFLGDIIGDLASRRGTIERTMMKGGGSIFVFGMAPLSEMFGYTTSLRSKSQGRASGIMEFDHYNLVPENIAQTIVLF
jgi:elongation factor G